MGVVTMLEVLLAVNLVLLIRLYIGLIRHEKKTAEMTEKIDALVYSVANLLNK
jgi:hypothetical protein